ncbi:hypothetical protein ACFQHW_10315 [Lapidilactobacillus achengensis]|uniref:Uncharacterized protein n=1 Tax=Lapidilactobacillus achengensis TaxID=2486000 RepID=A0ABW1UTJ9_9LACO|nr:hypothetical protein [Lapidilactobacillus achengensis]
MPPIQGWQPTNHSRQLRGSPSIGDSLPIGVRAQMTVITLSGYDVKTCSLPIRLLDRIEPIRHQDVAI